MPTIPSDTVLLDLDVFTWMGEVQELFTVTAVTATGSTIADAAALSTGVNIVTNDSAAKGVLLPTPSAAGEHVIIKHSAVDTNVYPSDAATTINSGSAGVAVDSDASTGFGWVWLVSTSTTNYDTIHFSAAA